MLRLRTSCLVLRPALLYVTIPQAGCGSPTLSPRATEFPAVAAAAVALTSTDFPSYSSSCYRCSLLTLRLLVLVLVLLVLFILVLLFILAPPLLVILADLPCYTMAFLAARTRPPSAARAHVQHCA